MFTTMIVLLALCPVFAQKKAQKKHETEPSHGVRRPEDVHSFMELFTNLEHEITTAMQAHDAAALEQSLAREFIFRNSDAPRAIVPRAEWLTSFVPRVELQSFAQSNLNVRVFPGDTALVSFVQTQKRSASAGPSTLMVVDVWTANHATNKWELVQRYQSIAASR